MQGGRGACCLSSRLVVVVVEVAGIPTREDSAYPDVCPDFASCYCALYIIVLILFMLYPTVTDMEIRTITDIEISIGTRVQGAPGVPLPLTLLLGHPGRSHLFLLVLSGSADRSRNLEACMLGLLPPTCGVWGQTVER